MLIAMIADVEPASIVAFCVYEERALALLERHGGRLERRLRHADGTIEIHLVSFADQAGYDGYMEDPERLSARETLAQAKVSQRVFDATDVAPAGADS